MDGGGGGGSIVLVASRCILPVSLRQICMQYYLLLCLKVTLILPHSFSEISFFMVEWEAAILIYLSSKKFSEFNFLFIERNLTAEAADSLGATAFLFLLLADWLPRRKTYKSECFSMDTTLISHMNLYCMLRGIFIPTKALLILFKLQTTWIIC